VPIGPRLPPHPQPELDVLLGAHVRKEAVRLEDHAHVAAIRRHVGEVAPFDDDAARAGPLEPRDDPKGRRLAATARPEQREELAPFDRHVQVPERGHVAEALVQLLELQIRHD
jgi:hypothetical protein